jgi:predicted Zn-dependent protease
MTLSTRDEWPGFYYDGHTADRQAVTVAFEPDGIRLRLADGSSPLWLIESVRQTQGSFSSEMTRLEFGSDPVRAVLVEQPGFARALRAAFPRNRTLRDPHARARLVMISSAIAASAVALYFWGAPMLAVWLAPRVPSSWEVTLGERVVDRMAPPSRRCGDSASVGQLRSVLDRLIVAGPKVPYDFRLFVVRDTTINAFAAPGGFVVVHSGLISAARSPEEFAGVLAHEVQHVMQQHSTRAMIREAPLRLAISSITGGTGLETAAGLAGSLGALRYRRADETEADREGLKLLQSAGVDARGMVSFMRTLETKGQNAPRFVTYLSSHPHSSQRVIELEALIGQQEATQPLLAASDWQRLRHLCD